MTLKSILSAITILTLVLQQAGSCKSKGIIMSKMQDQQSPSDRAYEYISSFKRGEEFSPPSQGIITNGQPDSVAVRILGKELAFADPLVRENIIDLLVDVGISTNAMQSEGAEVLSNNQIIEILVNEGLDKPDLGREAAMDALRKLVTQNDLSKHSEAIIRVLENSPTPEAFLLIAKSKPSQAKVLVDQLAMSSEWKDTKEVKIACAALGANEAEDEFIVIADSTEEAMDVNAFCQSLIPLSLIGTPRCLKAIASRLRTPLIFTVQGAYEKSVRLNVLEALLYNFPDQPVLYPNNIISESDYTKAELFCTKKLGISYTTPPPPFMTYRGYPFPPPK